MLFTLEETVVKYTWSREDGELRTEDILDSAPRPVLSEIRKARQNSQDKELGCLCHEGPWKEVMGQLECLCREHSPRPLLDSLHAHLEAGLCSCQGKSKKASRDFNMPKAAFEQKVWDLYTYFLNIFNTRLKDEDTNLSKLKKALYDTAEQCIIFMDVQRYFFLQSVKSLLQLAFVDNIAESACTINNEVLDKENVLPEPTCDR